MAAGTYGGFWAAVDTGSHEHHTTPEAPNTCGLVSARGKLIPGLQYPGMATKGGHRPTDRLLNRRGWLRRVVFRVYVPRRRAGPRLRGFLGPSAETS